MTKQEIEQAIENGKSVWWITDEYILDTTAPKVVELVYKDKYSYIKENKVKLFMKSGWWREFDISSLFKTKAEAEHYLHHANITRTEQLPFLTWEEFNKDTLGFDFTDNIGNKYRCHIVRDYRGGEDFIVLYDKNGTISVDEEWEATEENFYKAYDECVRLFKGE